MNRFDKASTSTRIASRADFARAVLACSVAALLLPLNAAAQETPPTETPASAAKELAIPLVEISQRAEQTTLILSRTEEALSRTTAIAEIEYQLPQIEESLTKRRKLLERALSTGGSRGRLSEASTEWSQARAQIQRWRKELELKLQEIETAIGSLSNERSIWKRTHDSAVAEGAPKAIVDRIQTTLRNLDGANANARKAQASLLTLQDRIVQQDLLATAAINQILESQRESRSSLFERDAPPLWRDLFDIRSSEHVDDVRASIGEDLRKLRDFADASASRFLLDLLIFIVVMRYASGVKRRLANPVDGVPPIGGSGDLFQRPIAIALLATILLARWVHGPAPIGFSTAISFGLIVPLVRLVPLLLPPRMRWVVWVLAVLIVLSRARVILRDAPLASEVLFILEALGMVATLLWLMRPARLQEIPADARGPRLMGFGMRATLVLLAASLVSSGLGFREFGLLIGHATMTSIYVAVILFAAAHAAEAAVEASFHTLPAQRLSFVRRRREAVLRATGRYASALAMIYWGYLTLRFFDLLEPASAAVRSILDASLSVGEIQISLGDVISFSITIVLAFMFSRLIRFFLEEEAFPRLKLRRGVGNAVATLLQYMILMIGFAFALSAAGMDFSRVALFAGAFSVGLGFGLQTVVNNFVSGLVLLFERPIQIGDMIDVGTLRGEVRRIGARSSTVRTLDGAEVIVPNANLISESVVNWTLSDRRRRLDLEVGVAYGTDPEVVLDLLRGVAAANPAVLDTPAPEALFTGFGDSSLNFRLRIWIPRFEESYRTRSDVGVAINAALRDANITIPFPQRDLHVRSVESDVIRSLDGPRQT